MKIVVTGGCGYIGSHVARAFKMNGDDVFVIDRVSREHTLRNLDGWFIDDFVSVASLSTIYDLAPDVVVHCAGTSLVGPSLHNPSEYWDNNVTRLIRLMDFLVTLPKKPLVLFSSSASVYGDPQQLPIPESHQVRPISPYGNTKVTAERILHDYYMAYDIPSVCFRFFNAAGAEPVSFDLGQEPDATHIIARVLEAAIHQRTFSINGNAYLTPDGTCIRDYVHVWDIAQAHVAVSRKLNTFHNPIEARIINLGTGEGISNMEIVNYARENYSLPAHLVCLPRMGDPGVLVADPSQAKQWLGWQPEFSDMKTIIDSAYKWYTRGI